MNTDLEDYYHELIQQVQSRADDRSENEAFVGHCTDLLEDAGGLNSFNYVHYHSPDPQNGRVDGYANGTLKQDGALTLVISDFRKDEKPASLTRKDIERLFRHLENFLRSSFRNEFHPREESSPGYRLAQFLCDQQRLIEKIRMFVLSSRQLSSRVEGIAEKNLCGRPVTYDVWDLSRLHRLESSGKGKEDLDIDLRQDYGCALTCLPAHLDSAGYKAYLAVVPGQLLSDIYDRWGARLLEQNVRCFLQTRVKVNKGIRNTILNEPHMFFAYNNGITATAEDVEVESAEGSLRLVRLKNFQIVNGGQTTASIFTSSKKDKASLSRIFVQMKLSIVPPERTTEVVPRISEYANSQNRVNAADFSANHPFHVRMEEFSWRIWAPAPAGSLKQSKWFYERARGQYLNEQSLMTRAAKTRFGQEYPRSQLFTKTDLAKFVNVWEGIPHVVCMGAQKNFAEFARRIGKSWRKDSNQFNEHYFRSTVARAIIFRRLEKIVSSQSWYEGGYRAQVVAHTLAKLADMLEARSSILDFISIWKQQEPGAGLIDALTQISSEINEVIVEPQAGNRNVTEWAKKEACWQNVQAREIPFPESLEPELISSEQVRDDIKDARKVQRSYNAIEAQTKVVNLGGAFWQKALDWAQEHQRDFPQDHRLMKIAAAMPAKLPTERQCIRLTQILEKLEGEGFPLRAQEARYSETGPDATP